MEYKVDLSTFRGPLDLLLFLVKRNEVDICDIPIAKVTEQFLDYLNVLTVVDVELAGEFLVMAATLMEIKSRLLLPRVDEEAEAHDDPRLELVKQLIEYKKYKEASLLLEQQAEKQLARLPRTPMEAPTQRDIANEPVRRVELWDLVSAFGRLMRETAALQPSQIVMDETPIHVHMQRVLDFMMVRQSATLREIFTPPHTRGRLVGIFLALLELIKARKIAVEQPQAFADIHVTIAMPPLEPSMSESDAPVAAFQVDMTSRDR